MSRKASTLVIGASENPARYSNKAIKMLSEYDHDVKAVGLRTGKVDDTEIQVGEPAFDCIDTVTLYVGEKRLGETLDYILRLKPRRIIFNPGAENTELYIKAKEQGIEVTEACTLVMLRTDQY